MTKLSPNSLHYYDHAVTDLMMEKYGFDRMEALRKFIGSKTHALLEDPENGLSSFGCNGIFDIWECEAVTGDPRNSIYIRGE
ncbi:MAG: hypothetical protein IKX79_01625 [Desulfovibrionaceae bacterium]|nr:hypothetical protein [Desulfovibrionaceae bacterium]MBO4793974.1 hypothetical protein [Deltaproteobacteria bacterium]MBR5734226.1 hypothetical protein [Desulfovibrionaceae bacterium]